MAPIAERHLSHELFGLFWNFWATSKPVLQSLGASCSVDVLVLEAFPRAKYFFADHSVNFCTADVSVWNGVCWAAEFSFLTCIL